MDFWNGNDDEVIRQKYVTMIVDLNLDHSILKAFCTAQTLYHLTLSRA